MVSILDRMDTARFRGVSFYVASRSRESGRRGDVAEHPHADAPTTYDTGRRAFSARVTGFVFTHDGYGARNALADALDQFGPGRYVDPWGLSWTVKVVRWTCSETVSRGGVADFQIEFVLAEDRALSVVSRLDTAWAVIEAGKALATTALDTYARIYAYGGFPEFVRAVALDTLRDFGARFLSDASLWGVIDGLSMVDAYASLTRGGNAADRAAATQSAIAMVSSVLPDSAMRTSFLLDAASYQSEPEPSLWTTSSRTAAETNQIATAAMIRRLALAQLAQETPSMVWESYDAAQSYAEQADAACLAEMGLAGGRTQGLVSTSVFSALTTVNAAISADARKRGARLAQLTQLTLSAPTPAAVLAYRLYGDAKRAGAIATRNRIADCNWLPSGRALEVMGS